MNLKYWNEFLEIEFFKNKKSKQVLKKLKYSLKNKINILK